MVSRAPLVAAKVFCTYFAHTCSSDRGDRLSTVTVRVSDREEERQFPGDCVLVSHYLVVVVRELKFSNSQKA